MAHSLLQTILHMLVVLITTKTKHLLLDLSVIAVVQAMMRDRLGELVAVAELAEMVEMVQVVVLAVLALIIH